MARSHRIRGFHFLGAALLALLPACAQHAWMMVPPKFDLHRYTRIGLLDVQCANRPLGEQATREFQELLLEAQPGSSVIVLPSVGADQLDSAHLRELASQQELDAIFLGSLELSENKPKIGITSSLVQVSARSEIVGTLNTRLLEPASGATVWSRTASERATLASGAINSRGEGSLGIEDAQQVRSDLLHTLVSQVTHDFRAQYFRKRVDDIPPDYRLTYPDGVEVYVPPEVADARN